jgi:hypothetical protein
MRRSETLLGLNIFITPSSEHGLTMLAATPGLMMLMMEQYSHYQKKNKEQFCTTVHDPACSR